MADGRKMKVTVEIKVNFVWKKVDTSKYSDEKDVLKKLITRCEGIYATTTKESDKPKSLTVHFERNNNTESFWKSRVLGKVFTSLKEDIIQLDFKKLEYKTTASDTTQVFDLENEELGTLETSMVRAHLRVLAPVAKGIYYDAHRLTANRKKTKNQSDPVSAVIDKCIEDAGAKGNRCAALSLAKIELDKNSIEDIVDNYELDEDFTEDFNLARPEHKLEMLAEALVQKTADTIEDTDPDNPFLDEDIQDHRQPGLAAIKYALREMKQSDTGTAEEITERYAGIIRQPGQMLDLPFFLALEQPFIIIHKPHPAAPNKIMVLGEDFIIPDTIEDCDLDDVNILFYNSRDHYQSVTLESRDPDITDKNETAMRVLIRREMDQRIDSLINRLKTPGVGADAIVEERKDALDLYAQYPKGLEELVQKLQIQYPTKLTTGVIDQIIDDAIPFGETRPSPSAVCFALRQAIHS